MKITEKRKRASAAEPVSVMYVGPSIENVVRKSTVFKNGVLPETLQAVINSKPYMKRLLIPINELPQAMKELSNPKSVLSTLFFKAKKETK